MLVEQTREVIIDQSWCCSLQCTMICNAETAPYINAAGEAWYGVRKRGLISASWTKVDLTAMVNGFASGQISTWNYDRIHLR